MIVLRNAGVVVFNICMNYICTVYHLFIDQYKVLMNFEKPVKCQCNFLKYMYHEYDHSPKDYGWECCVPIHVMHIKTSI